MLRIVEKTRQKIDSTIMSQSTNFSNFVVAISRIWIKAGKVIPIGDPSKAPRTPKNFSMSFANTIPRSAADKATKNLDSLLNHVSTFDLYSGGLIPKM